VSSDRVTDIFLREVIDSDLPIFFEQQLDKTANHMAAFIGRDPTDRDAFMAHWDKIRSDANITLRTILVDDQVVGNVTSFPMFGELDVSYWIGKAFWGRGIATLALKGLLRELTVRPLHARVAKDNLASLRVLQKCGFTIYGEGKGFAKARKEDVEEHLLKLEA
jgi:RimJ/RimL family protein N-acetyltransferase